MDPTNPFSWMELGVNVGIVAMFLRYLSTRDKMHMEVARDGHNAARSLATAVEELRVTIAENHPARTEVTQQ